LKLKTPRFIDSHGSRASALGTVEHACNVNNTPTAQIRLQLKDQKLMVFGFLKTIFRLGCREID
jgi:hypothetical protein